MTANQLPQLRPLLSEQGEGVGECVGEDSHLNGPFQIGTQGRPDVWLLNADLFTVEGQALLGVAVAQTLLGKR